jgi:hypothetical protein
MKTHLSILLIGVLSIGCHKKQAEEENSWTRVSSEGKTVESVYLTHDDQNNPVVVWTEKDKEELKLSLAISHDNGKTFSQRKNITLTSDVATHAESMPKVAFKKDGTIVAVYEKKAPSKENKYAGAIYYITSKDKGTSWTKEAFLHSDTVAGRSRSYFDIERLPDGEIGASWLDIKLNNHTGGRSVKFAKTSNAKFSNEILIDSSACQCCRIDVYSDIAGRINIAYRGLMKGNMGKSIRDMMLSTSTDQGQSFSQPERISQDNWAIDGCPHTGPSLCSNKSGLYSFWYTEGNGTGIYYSFKQNKDATFGQRQLISTSGHHPQSSAAQSRMVMVWEENNNQSQRKFANVFYQLDDGMQIKRGNLTPRESNAFLPVITQTNDGFVVAFLMETKDGEVGMFTTKL